MFRDSIKHVVNEAMAVFAGWKKHKYRVEKIGDLTILHVEKNPVTAEQYLKERHQ